MSSMDAAPKSPEELIGNIPFGFTAQAVEEAAAEMREELNQINAGFEAGTISEGIIKFAEDRKALIEKFLATPVEEVIKNFQAIYDFVVQQEKQGLKGNDIFGKMESEKPELVKVVYSFPFIETQKWGYRLHQHFIAYGMAKDRTSKDGPS